MDVGRAINYVFQDPQWVKKVAIGGALFFVPIIGWLMIYGYFMRNLRQVATGTDLPLPEWDDFGGDLVRGLKGWLASLVWALPIVLILGCVTIPFAIASDGAGDDLASGPLFLFNCLSAPIGLIYAFIAPLIISRVAMTDAIGPALDVRAVIREAQQVAAPLLVALVVQVVLNFLAGFGVILCFIGVFFTAFVAYVMMSHLWGQIRRQLDLGAQPPVAVASEPTL